MNRWLAGLMVAAIAMGIPGWTPVPARESPIVIEPGAMAWWARQTGDRFSYGTVDFLGHAYVFCRQQSTDFKYFRLTLLLENNGDVWGCSNDIPRADVVVNRLETIHLPEIGASQTIAVEMRPIRFSESPIIFGPCFLRANGRFFAPAGTMEIVRTSEYGGTAEMKFLGLIDGSFYSPTEFGQPTRVTTRLGPYHLVAKLEWSVREDLFDHHLVPYRPTLCTDCLGSMALAGESIIGYGTTADSATPVRLEGHGMGFPFLPTCVIEERTSTEGPTWSVVKGLYRD